MPRSSSQTLDVLFSISSNRILGLKGVVEIQELVMLAYAFRVLDGLCQQTFHGGSDSHIVFCQLPLQCEIQPFERVNLWAGAMA